MGVSGWDGGVAENVKNGRDGSDGAKNGPQVQQQLPPQGAMVCWERFLHLRALKVLLVENDDSTRHVVTALLRNCSYEVIEAANELQAWKILEDLTNHVDLVLTEVVMPCLSGIGLLYKIMSHKSRKNVPVIMMSSHDSMGLVFKCLSKGAVDFLVKPIRKNELKNLWQHVWRRCHSSSGSGSESVAHTQKSVKSMSVEDSDNNAGSNDEEENESIGLNVGDGSDNGSGTQSSWTKQAVEVDSPRRMSSYDQIPECPDSTCALVVHPNVKMHENQLVSDSLRKDCRRHKEKIDKAGMGKDLEVGIPDKLNLQLGYPDEVPTNPVVQRQNNHVEMDSSKCNELINNGRVDFDFEKPSTKLKHENHAVTGSVPSRLGLQMDNRANFQAQNGHSNVFDVSNKGINDADEIPSLGLSLKRSRGSKDEDTTVNDDRNVLRHSDSSAFSRYNATSNTNKTSTSNVGSSFLQDSSMEVMKQEFPNILSQSSSIPPNQSPIRACNNINIGYRSDNAFSDPVILKQSITSPPIQQLHPSSAPKDDLSCTPKQVIMNNTDYSASLLPTQPKVHHKEHHTQHQHIHNDKYQVHHHLVHGVQQQHPTDHNEFSLKKLAKSALRCGSSDVLSGPGDGNTGKSSINRSTSGSNHGNSTAISVGGTNIESDNGVSGKSGSADASWRGREIETKSAHREAALTKFRQKRKERCFRKKVRYQSRKRLAEQRPRVRGQFVRQTSMENTSRASDS